MARSILCFLLLLVLPGCGSSKTEIQRQPAHAGGFYPLAVADLDKDLEAFLSQESKPLAHVPKAIIVPHAGYQFSGPVAGLGFKTMVPGADKIQRVILMAPSHYAAFQGVVVNERTYNTPLGFYPSDREALAALKKAGLTTRNEIAETREHADEVEIPFLQKVLPKARLVPLIVGDLDGEMLERAAKALSLLADEKTIIVVSSDFTHYGPNYGYTPFKTKVREGIEALDQQAIRLISAGDLPGFSRFLEQTQETICGRNPIQILLKIFEFNNWKPDGTLLAYATSGGLTGDFTNSVSYVGLALGALEEKGGAGESTALSRQEEETLLKLSRRVLGEYIKAGKEDYPEKDLKKFKLTQPLRKTSGVFVTLKKAGALRGCIGHIQGRLPLFKGVIENTINAAARDPRFPPVKPEELKDIDIEISVMSLLMKVNSIQDDIQVGRDGLVLTVGPYSGVFLPQVPGEQGWDKTTYLEELGLKAGLNKAAYKDKSAVIYKFTAQVFGEKER